MWAEASLIRGAGPLWQEATCSPFLNSLADGSLPAKAFQRWLSQDYLFAKGLTTFQAILVSKAPRDCHRPLISGLAALDGEMVVADQTLRNEITKRGLRETMRKTGLSQHTIEAIRAGQPVRRITLKRMQAALGS